MEISLVDQISNFFFSTLFGAVLGIIYDLFKTVNVILRPTNKKLFISDIIYLSLCGLLSFLFIVAVNTGEIRFYFFAGELIGWLIYHFTLGRLAFKILEKTVILTESIMLKIITIIPPIPKIDVSKFKIFKKLQKNCHPTKKLSIGNIKRLFNRTN